MAKILDFTGKRAFKRFEFCLGAILQAGDKSHPRGKDILKLEAELLDAFDSISEEQKGDIPRKLNGGVRLLISDKARDLLQLYVDTLPWAPIHAQGAIDVMSFVEKAEQSVEDEPSSTGF